MSKGWVDPESIETRVYAPPQGSGARPAPVRVPVPHAQPHDYDYDRSGHSVSNAAAELFTRPVERRVEDRPLITPVTLALAAFCVTVGVTIGSVIGFSGDDADASPAPTAPALAPATAPAAKPAPAAAPAPKPTATPIVAVASPNTLRVESQPPGATVMFVRDGAATLVGTTPIDTTIDPAHDYDVLVTLADHASKIEHVTPHSSHHLVVALGAAAR